MAKARVSVENSEIDPDTRAEAEELAQLNEDEGGEIFRAIDELRGVQGTTVVIVKISPAEEAGFCDNVAVAEFSHEMMKNRYGAGSYKVRIRGPKGWIPGGGNVRISPVGIKPKPGAASQGDFQTYLEYTQRQEAERKARTDDWIKLALTTVAPIIAAWMSRPAASGPDIAALVSALKPVPGPSLADLSQVMVNMKTMTEPKEQNSSMIDTVFKAFEFAKEMGGGGEGAGTQGGSNWVDVIRDVIKAAPEAIKPMLEARMAAMQAGQPVGQKGAPIAQVNPQISTAPTVAGSTPAQNPNPVSNFVGNAPSTPNSEGDMLSMFLPLAKANLSKVAGWAEKNRDPQVYADVLVDELPDNFGNYVPLDDVLKYLQHPEWFETVCTIEPRLKEYREWCDECRLAIIDIMKVFEQETSQDEPAKSDTLATVAGQTPET